jgi:hypothetical protein
MDRSEYPSLVVCLTQSIPEYPSLHTDLSMRQASLQPEQAVTVLNDRVSLITKVNNDIADWLQERRKVEEAYVVGLRKLARRQQQDGGAALGSVHSLYSVSSLYSKLKQHLPNAMAAHCLRDRKPSGISRNAGNED